MEAIRNPNKYRLTLIVIILHRKLRQNATSYAMTFTELVNFLKQSRKYDLGSFLFEHVTPAENQNKIIDCADR